MIKYDSNWSMETALSKNDRRGLGQNMTAAELQIWKHPEQMQSLGKSL